MECLSRLCCMGGGLLFLMQDNVGLQRIIVIVILGRAYGGSFISLDFSQIPPIIKIEKVHCIVL